MRTIILIIAISIVAVSFPASAQQRGLHLGIEANPGVMVEQNADSKNTIRFNPFASYGINTSWYWSDNWAVTGGVQMAKYNYKNYNNLTYLGVTDLRYLQIPVGLVCKNQGPSRVNGYYSFGIMTYLLQDSHFSPEKTYYNPGPIEQGSEADLNKMNIGPYVGGGACFKLSRKFSAQLGTQFATGLFNIRKDGNPNSSDNASNYLMTLTAHFQVQMELVSGHSKKSNVQKKNK